jgi:septum site-determining protein MinD
MHGGGGADVGQVLAVISGKGGTGKTSVCAGVSSCLAAEGKKVLAIDEDVGLRNLDISLGMSDMAVLPFSSVMRGEYGLDKAAAHPKIDGLYLLTAPVTEEPEALDPLLFGDLLESARQKFDFILIDAPAGIGAGFRLATRFADGAIVVAGSDPASLRDAARAAELLPENLPAKLVVNRVSSRLYARMNATVDDVMDGVGLPLLGIVPEDVSVTLASAQGEALILYTSRGAACACLHIARRILGKKAPLMRL